MIEFIPVETRVPPTNRPVYGFWRSQPVLVKLANGEITTAILMNRATTVDGLVEPDLRWFGHSFKYGEEFETDELMWFEGEIKVVEWFDLGNNIG